MSKWISVEDRLPEMIGRGDRSESVLILRKTKDGKNSSHAISFLWSDAMIMSMSFNDEFSHTDTWNGQESNGYRVTHWIPLPESPKGE